MSKIKLIYASSLNGYIGKKGKIPWHIPEDLQRFKVLTTGHAVLMGRKTWDSLPAIVRPLPDRRNIVVSSNDNWGNFPNVTMVAKSVEEAIVFHRANASYVDLWVIGGESVFNAALPFADEVYQTLVDKMVDGDAKAPSQKDLLKYGFDIQLGLNGQWRTSVSGERYCYVHWTKQ